MPIPLPDLDNRTYDDLLEEARSLIPRYASDWTDHNASDPGIMLIELFTWLTEALIYRLNRIPETSQMRFLELLGATTDSATTLDDARDQVAAILKTWRTITQADFESLVVQQEEFKLARAKCIPELDLTKEGEERYIPRPGHVSIIVVPREVEKQPTEECIRQVFEFLDNRRLITSHHHVVGPRYAHVGVDARVVRTSLSEEQGVREAIQNNLWLFFLPLKSDRRPGGEGWPFGQAVSASEVYEVIESTEGVDHVELLKIYSLERDEEGQKWERGPIHDRLGIPCDHLIHYVRDYSDLEIMSMR